MKLTLLSILLGLITFMDVNASYRTYVQDYIQQHKDIAVAEMHRTGIPASIKLAQGMLESNWGRSELARTANNHFGIKCGSAWKGGAFYKEDDDRDRNGKLIKSCFRSFDSAYDSYVAHSDFLTDPNKAYRYGKLFKLKRTDYKAWAKGLRKSGYATDKKYPKKLISLIEKYNLDQYDKAQVTAHAAQDSIHPGQTIITMDELSTVRRGGPSGMMDSKAKSTSIAKEATNLKLDASKINGIKVVFADGQSSIEQIAKSLKKKPLHLLKYNELFKEITFVPAEGIPVFLHRKKSSFAGKSKHHIVVEGETMASIAHMHGIRLKSLYLKNRIPLGAEALIGEKLNLHRSVSKRNAPKYTMKVVDDSKDQELLFLDDDTLK